MKPESIAALAALVSAFSALVTTYLYRRQGKGFVWAKDPKVQFAPLPNGKLYLAVEVPLLNLGTGTIRFKSFSAQKVYLKTGSVEPFDRDMDEAYFPPGVEVLTFKTPIYDDAHAKSTSGIASEFRIHRFEINQGDFDGNKLSDEINQKLAEIGEVLFILRCDYKDGSWFGWKTIKTTIAMELKGLDLSYLSSGRRKALDKLFK